MKTERIKKVVVSRHNLRLVLSSALVLLVLYVGGDVLKMKWIKPNLWYALSVPLILVGTSSWVRYQEGEREAESNLDGVEQIPDSNEGDEDYPHDEFNPFDQAINGIDGSLPPLLESDVRTAILSQVANMPPGESMVEFVNAAARLLPAVKQLPQAPLQTPVQYQSVSPTASPANETSSRPQPTATRQQPKSTVTTANTNQPAQTPSNNTNSKQQGSVVELFPGEESEDAWGETTDPDVAQLFPDPGTQTNTPTGRRISAYGSNVNWAG
jgi:hypothetical protein